MKKTIIALALLLALAGTALACPPPPGKAVDLAWFRATRGSGGVRLEWETGQELDNLGFNAYRADGSRVNAGLVPARNLGTPLGARYELEDPVGSPLYWLEDVDAYGQATLHGPFAVAGRLRLARARLAPSAPVLGAK